MLSRLQSFPVGYYRIKSIRVVPVPIRAVDLHSVFVDPDPDDFLYADTVPTL